MVSAKAELKLVLWSALALLTTSITTTAQTIYFDDFSGAGAAVNGTTPDTSSTGASWAAGANLKDNGSIAGVFTAVLPFQPQPNNVYTLSAALNAVAPGAAANENWIGLGFTQVQQVNLATSWLAAGQPALWAMSRTNTAVNFDQSFLGFAGSPAGQTAGAVNSTTKSTDSITMTLDTTALEWVWTVDFASDSVIDRTETITNIPNINFVGLTMSAALGAASSVDNFQLTQVEVPVNEWNVNGGGNFGTAGNWTMGVPTVGSKVLFGDVLTALNAPAVVNMNVAASLNQVQFANSQTYSIQGASTLTLTGEATVATFSGTHEIGARIAGSSGLRKFGGGTLILSNDTNSFTGDVTVSGGTLEITELGSINQASGVVSVASGSTFRFGGDGAGGGASGTLTEQITGAGTVRLHSTLTTEVVSFASPNAGFTGAVSIGGGTLRVQDAGALGSATGVVATGTQVGGAAETGKVELAGVTVTGEHLQIAGRTEDNLAPALTSTGSSRWEGPIAGSAGGNQYTIESQAGSSLTLTGNITMPDDTTTRLINLTGPAGSSGRIEGKIVDRTVANADGAENVNVSVIKRGAGTWTIATGTSARDDFHQRDTVVEQGTLAVEGISNAGELWSRTIDVRSGATFDVSSFTSYSLQLIEDPDVSFPNVTGDEVGQELRGSGTVIVGGTLQAFDDSIITPGDSVGTLNISGNYSYSTFGQLATGRWNYELGSTTAPAVSDRVVVSGSATINAGDADDVINLNVSPVQGTLSSGAYTLVQAAAVGGTATNGNYAIKLRDAQGNDITSGARQTFSVSNTATTVNLDVVGTSANLNWAGTAGSVWDVKNTNNWTGAGGPQFNQLDNVTFGNVANKNVTVSTNVAPGTVNFSGGVGSTYVITGTGGMTGFAPVNVNSGTVKLQNTGNAYAGTTTIVANARLEMASATTGSIVANGALAVSGSTASTLIDNFNDGNISEYTTYTTLDQVGTGTTVGPPDDVVFSSSGTGITANGGQNGNPAAEQSIAVRAASLGIGETLVVDANLNTNAALFSTVGIAIADSAVQTDIPSGNANADIRKSYLYNGMRLSEATDGSDARNFQSNGTTANGGAGGVGEVTNLWITRTSADDYTSGYSKDGMATRVTTFTHSNMDWTPDSAGFYADIRGVVSPNVGTFDNLRIAPAQSNVLQVNGDLTLGSTGTIELDLGQDSWDLLNVTGEALLQGTIEVNLSGAFDIADGRQYTILTAAEGITDLGLDLLLPDNFSAEIVNTTQLVLTYSAALAGDFNDDGAVDAADYVLWRKVNNNPTDYDDWRENFGSSSSGSGSGSGNVPEPTALAALAVACGCATGLRRRQPRCKQSSTN